MFFKKRSQAAFEYLTTYSWAFIAVIISIGALYYFGILSPDNFTMDICRLDTGITCTDFRVEPFRTILSVKNNLGTSIQIEQFKIIKSGLDLCTTIDTITLENNDKGILTILGCNNGIEGGKFQGDIEIQFLNKETGIIHIQKGEIISKVVSGSSLSLETICQTAQDNELCDGLNIAYGYGYKEACCSEHSICC